MYLHICANERHKCCILSMQPRAYLRWGFRGFKPPPPPKFSDFFLKSEGKEIERKRKKGMFVGGGGLPLNIFLGLIFFRVGLRYFQGGGVEKFSWGGVEKFSGRGLRNFRGGVEKFSVGGGV